MVWLVVFTEYQLHLRSEALRSCSEGQNFLFPCWNSILSFLLQMFRLTRPPEAQIRTNLRPSVASVGLSFLGITLWNIPPHDLSGHGTEEHVAGRAEEHDVDYNGLCQGWFGWWHSPNINFIYKARHCAAVRRSENSVPLPVQHSIFLAANVSLNFRLKCQ